MRDPPSVHDDEPTYQVAKPCGLLAISGMRIFIPSMSSFATPSATPYTRYRSYSTRPPDGSSSTREKSLRNRRSPSTSACFCAPFGVRWRSSPVRKKSAAAMPEEHEAAPTR